jgi:hypothetical protein
LKLKGHKQQLNVKKIEDKLCDINEPGDWRIPLESLLAAAFRGFSNIDWSVGVRIDPSLLVPREL